MNALLVFFALSLGPILSYSWDTRLRGRAVTLLKAATVTSVTAIWLVAALPPIASGQTLPPVRDPVIAAVTQAMREGRKADAEKILTDAIHSTEQSAPESPQLAVYLKRLAGLHGTQPGSDGKALFDRAVEIDKKAYGPNGSMLAEDMYMIAVGYEGQKKPEEAERILMDAISLLRRNPDPDLDIFAIVLSQLGSLYTQEGRLAEATPLYEEAVKDCDSAKPNPGTCDLFRRNLKDLDRRTGRTEDANRLQPTDPEGWQLDELNRQAREYVMNGLYLQAEDTYRRAIDFVQQHPEHLFGTLGRQFALLGQVLEKQGRDSDVEQAYLRGIEVEENAAGPKPPQSLYAQSLEFHLLIDFYRRKGRLQEAEPVIEHGLEIQEKYLPPQNKAVAGTLTTLADLYRDEAKYAQAKPLYERILAIQEKNLGPDDPGLLPLLNTYSDILRRLHDDAAAAEVQARINSIRNNPVQKSGPK